MHPQVLVSTNSRTFRFRTDLKSAMVEVSVPQIPADAIELAAVFLTQCKTPKLNSSASFNVLRWPPIDAPSPSFAVVLEEPIIL
jgi:hypothetical protein